MSNNTSKEIVEQYQKINSEYQTLFTKMLEINEEKREHELIIENIKDLNPERRAWRLIGGILVEKTIGEINPELANNLQSVNFIRYQLYWKKLKNEQIKKKRK